MAADDSRTVVQVEVETQDEWRRCGVKPEDAEDRKVRFRKPKKTILGTPSLREETISGDRLRRYVSISERGSVYFQESGSVVVAEHLSKGPFPSGVHRVVNIITAADGISYTLRTPDGTKTLSRKEPFSVNGSRVRVAAYRR